MPMSWKIVVMILWLVGTIGKASESADCSNGCLADPVKTEVSCNMTSGDCIFGCYPGYAGKNCTTKCPQNCLPPIYNDTDMCNNTSMECFSGCKDGFYGGQCKELCSASLPGCSRCSLQKNRVVCNECILNFYRDNGKCLACNHWCEINVSSPLRTCREIDGYCNFGCKPGRHGNKCNKNCNTNCKNSCHRNTGTCFEGCNYLSYCGQTCERTCNDGCLSKHCNQSCSCSLGCIQAKWGEQCENDCSKNCKKSNGAGEIMCERVSGVCMYGCEDAYFGKHCNHTCPPECVSRTCQQSSGNSTKGIVEGNIFFIVGLISGWVLFSVVLVIVIIAVCRRHRPCKVSKNKQTRSDDRKKEHRCHQNYNTLNVDRRFANPVTYEILSFNEGIVTTPVEESPYANLAASQL